ncbi:MAG: ribosomal protein L11 methyltransferase [Candidatus Melainabacteria bacterium GWF2_37_15]|nr:MAG: ribosomal protein L11 methyltransferase [Candidatus Melainabacteria bacterium GWF2_37_15]
MSQHIEICVETCTLWAEYVSQLLIDKLGCNGTVMEDGAVKGYLPFTKNPDLSLLQDWPVSTKIIKDEEWAENWKRYWHPLKVSEKIVICPSWEQYAPENGEIVISLDPGSAFGTGTHATTRLCIEAIEKIVPQFSGEISMADIGTGSGILSICGVKLGIKSATGVDNDASVIPVAIENAQINSVDGDCEFFTGSACSIKGKYEIVTANILAEVIIEIVEELKNLLKPNGTMILSGIIEKKLADVENALNQAGLKTREVLTEQGWVAVIAGF